jgi:hypothetical protein
MWKGLFGVALLLNGISRIESEYFGRQGLSIITPHVGSNTIKFKYDIQDYVQPINSTVQQHTTQQTVAGT